MTTELTVDRLLRTHALGKLLGDAPAFREAIASLPAIARADATVLLNGETGTGKELVARAIHYLSERRAAAFIAVNCGALPDTLLEDEFFGHERGAFTDAKASRPGLLRQAHGGTLFLDEVDSLSPRAQVSLLRVLQDRTYRALGSSVERHTDMRVIAATNTPLWPLIAERGYRSDLYYRLSVLTIDLPPLRDRRDDVLPLTHHFLLKLAPAGRGPFRLSADAKHALLSHSWPGNVRELENAVWRAVSLAEDDVVTAVHFGLRQRDQSCSATPPFTQAVTTVLEGTSGSALTGSSPAFAELDVTQPFGELKRQTLWAFERAYLLQLMSTCRGNVSLAARAARKERSDLRRLLHRHCLDPRAFGC